MAEAETPNLQFDQAEAVAKNPEADTDTNGSIDKQKTIASFTTAVKEDIAEIRNAMKDLPDDNTAKTQFEANQTQQLTALETALKDKQETELIDAMNTFVETLNTKFQDAIKVAEGAQTKAKAKALAPSNQETSSKSPNAVENVKGKANEFAENMVKQAEELGLPKDMLASILKGLCNIAFLGDIFKPIYERLRADNIKNDVNQILGTDHKLNDAEMVKLYDYYEAIINKKDEKTTAKDILTGPPTFAAFLNHTITKGTKPDGGWTYKALVEAISEENPKAEKQLTPDKAVVTTGEVNQDQETQQEKALDANQKNKALEAVSEQFKNAKINDLIGIHTKGKYPNGFKLDDAVKELVESATTTAKETTNTVTEVKTAPANTELTEFFTTQLSKPDFIKLAMAHIILKKLELNTTTDNVTINENGGFELTIKPTSGDNKTITVTKSTANGQTWKIDNADYADDTKLAEYIKTIKSTSAKGA